MVFGGPDGPLTKTEAAKLAGYSEKRCRQEGSELTNPRLNPLVVKYIGELKEERLKKYEVNYASHVAELGRIKDAALKKGLECCCECGNKQRQSSRIIYRPQNNKNRKARGPIRTRVRSKKMKQILDDYSQIIDVTPDTEEVIRKKITE